MVKKIFTVHQPLLSGHHPFSRGWPLNWGSFINAYRFVNVRSMAPSLIFVIILLTWACCLKHFTDEKDGGACRRFWKESLGGIKILFCGRGFKCFSPLRGTNLLSYNKSSRCGPFEAEHLKSTKTTFLTHKGCDEHPRPFYQVRIPPPRGLKLFVATVPRFKLNDMSVCEEK